MTTKIIMAHHGSLGSERDFFHLKLLMPEFHFVFYDQLKILPRIQVGYSLGCVEAISSAIRNKTTEKVILISPCLYPEQQLGINLKHIMHNRPFRNSILKALGPKKIEHILHSSVEKEFDTAELFSALKILEKRKVPVIIIYGEQNSFSSYDYQIRPLLEYSNVEEFCISGAGHDILWTHTQTLAEKIIFLCNDMNYEHKAIQETGGSYAF